MIFYRRIGMLNGRRIIAFIPARGGSKGIPGKNLMYLEKKPLISYTIEAARQCTYIDRIVVSTDSEEIAHVARQYGAEIPFMRPRWLAEDNSKTIDAVIYTLDKLEEGYDILVLLQPTSPLRTSMDIEAALQVYFEQGTDVVSVSEVQEHPLLIRRMENKKLYPLLKKNSTVRRQDMEKYVRVNGAIYINQIKNLCSETSFNDNPAYYEMDVSHSVDIDLPVDYAICQYYLQNRKS